MTVSFIMSGGQTGADRGALDAAIDDLLLDWGGWAPRGFRSEDGVIPARYQSRLHAGQGPLASSAAGWQRGLIEHRSSGYDGRTAQNVADSDGTLVVSLGPLRPGGGSAKTLKIARRIEKPCLHVVVPADGELAGYGLEHAREWLAMMLISRLNVAGPRESVEPGIHIATRRAVRAILADEARARGVPIGLWEGGS